MATVRNYSGPLFCSRALSWVSCLSSGVSVLPGSHRGSVFSGWSHPTPKSAKEVKVVANVLFFIMMLFFTG